MAVLTMFGVNSESGLSRWSGGVCRGAAARTSPRLAQARALWEEVR